ncbi:MAG: hypothetical protein ACYSWU_15500 [Planctomycetota bacterium]
MSHSIRFLAIGAILCLAGCAEEAAPLATSPRSETAVGASGPAKVPGIVSPIAFDEDKRLITICPKTDAKDKRQFGMGLGSVTVETLGHDNGQFVFEYTCEIEGGYNTYRCRIPVAGPPATVQLPGGATLPKTSFDLYKCEIVGKGNMLLAGTDVTYDDPPKVLLWDYHGEVETPEDLYNTYADVLRAMETGDQAEIEKSCLPHSVTFTTGARPEKTREYGEDMNLPFLKSGFHRDILDLRKDSEDTYLIRTGSSYLFFVRTKTTGWKLHRYGDKPIE